MRRNFWVHQSSGARTRCSSAPNVPAVGLSVSNPPPRMFVKNSVAGKIVPTGLSLLGWYNKVAFRQRVGAALAAAAAGASTRTLTTMATAPATLFISNKFREARCVCMPNARAAVCLYARLGGREDWLVVILWQQGALLCSAVWPHFTTLCVPWKTVVHGFLWRPRPHDGAAIRSKLDHV